MLLYLKAGQNEIQEDLHAAKYKFERFNFDGSDKFIVVDQANAPTVFNTSLAATDVSDFFCQQELNT